MTLFPAQGKSGLETNILGLGVIFHNAPDAYNISYIDVHTAEREGQSMRICNLDKHLWLRIMEGDIIEERDET